MNMCIILPGLHTQKLSSIFKKRPRVDKCASLTNFFATVIFLLEKGIIRFIVNYDYGEVKGLMQRSCSLACLIFFFE
jgi:hypothetical protein